MLDGLVATGAHFERMYAYYWCSPSRASIMSGRFPVHIYQAEGAPEPPLPDSGLPLGMTPIAEKLQAVGYHTVQAGKWHLGNGRPAFLAKLEALGYEVTFIEAALSFQVRWYHAASVMSPVS